MLVDYHIHTNYSDGKGLHEEFVKEAIQKEVAELGFSDHFSILPTDWNTEEEDIPRINEQIEVLKSKTELPVRVKFGAEVDYIPGKEKEIENLIASLPLDYVIGSVHFIGEWNFDTSPKSFKGKDIDEVYEQYFELLNLAVNTGFYDIVGHADLIKKFGHRPSEKPLQLYEKVIKSIKAQDMTVELNTNGRNKPCKEFYPEETFLEMCRQYNVPVIISSDAHKPIQIAQYFDEALKQIKNLGYTQLATFTDRKREMIDIDFK